MSTQQTSSHLAPRFRTGLGTVLTTVGVLIAIAVTIIILALTGANHTTGATPVTASQANGNSTPHTHYLGPHQLQAAAQMHDGGSAPTAGVGNPAAHYTCLEATQRCLR